MPLNLSTLQQICARRFGYKAKETLDIMQGLYELISFWPIREQITAICLTSISLRLAILQTLSARRYQSWRPRPLAWIKRKNIKLLTQAKLRLTTLLSRPLKAERFSLIEKERNVYSIVAISLYRSLLSWRHTQQNQDVLQYWRSCVHCNSKCSCAEGLGSPVKIPKKTMRRMRKYKPALIYLCYRSMMMVCVSLQASIRKQRLLLATSRIQRYLLQWPEQQKFRWPGLKKGSGSQRWRKRAIRAASELKRPALASLKSLQLIQG